MEKEIKEMQKEIGCDAGSVWLRDEEDDNILYPYIFLGEKSLNLQGMVLNIDTGICGHCVKYQEEIITNDMSTLSMWYSQADTKTGFTTNNIICLPIIIDDYCYGCVQLLNKETGFNDNDVKIARKMIDFIIENI